MSDDLVPDYNQPQSRDAMPRPYVTPEMRSKEVRSTNGEVSYVDEVWVKVMAPGGKDVLEKLADDWLAGLKAHGEAGRIPSHWHGEYKTALASFKAGEELPLQGTPIKTWTALTPGQRKAVLGANILIVEDLAGATDEAKIRIGMGAEALVTTAKAWVKEQAGPGAMAAQLAALTARLTDLETANQELRDSNTALSALVPKAPAKEK